MSSGAELIAAERRRQVEVEGLTAERDDRHVDGEMLAAAIAYILASQKTTSPNAADFFPATWDAKRWKPSEDRVRNLVKAGALIAAEIDRLQRAAGVE